MITPLLALPLCAVGNDPERINWTLHLKDKETGILLLGNPDPNQSLSYKPSEDLMLQSAIKSQLSEWQQMLRSKHLY